MTFELYPKSVIHTAEYLGRLTRRLVRAARQTRDPQLRGRVFERDKGVCKCGKVDPCWIHDHIIPLADGGPDTLENSQTLCRECEKPKTAREARARAKTKRLNERNEEFKKRRAIPGAAP